MAIRSTCLVLALLGTHAYAAPTSPVACKPGRFVFDPPGARHNVPQLTYDANGYTLVAYDGPPSHILLTTIDPVARKTKQVTLADGALPQAASNGAQIGIAFLGPEPVAQGPVKQRYQSYFVVVNRDGKVVVPKLALGDRTASHSAPGVLVAWSPERKEWGVVWTEGTKVQLARISAAGKLAKTIALPDGTSVSHQLRMVWTGRAYAFAAATPTGLVLLQIDDDGARQVPIAKGSALEPVTAFAQGTFAVAYRTDAEQLVVVRIKDGKELGRSVIADLRKGAQIASGPATRPAPSPNRPPDPLPKHVPMLSSLSLAADGAGFVLVWEQMTSGGGFNSRLHVARLDGNGAIAAGYPKRIDGEDTHQGYASIAGSGCGLAVSYILGDPNGDVRVAFVQAP
ncbi:MAG TPA: hypothetical protein VFQ53_03990 [Kofleriaceae bacterium]|nr:hypothetical protein [Kofleriaceae bacterium]